MDILAIVGGCIMLLLILGIFPVMIGALFTASSKKEESYHVIYVYMVGTLVMLALSEVLSVPMTLLKMSFQMFVVVYSFGIFAMLILAIFVARKRCISIFHNMIDGITHFQLKWVPVLIGIFGPIIVLAFFTTYIYGDDRVYLAMVNDIVSSNRLYLTNINTGDSDGWVIAKYALSSYWTWIAYIVKMTGIHTLILCKTIWAFIFVPLAYAIQYMLAKYLFFHDERKVYVFMLILILVCIFGGFSTYTVTYRLYTWIWQSKAFLAVIVLPFLFYYCNTIFEAIPKGTDYLVLFIMILGTCSTTLTGTGLAVGMVCLLALYYSIVYRKVGIFLKSFLMCTPAYFLMLFYLKYDAILYRMNFYGLLGS